MYTPENATKAVALLDQKLRHWDSVPFRVLSSLLTVIGERRVVEARPQLEQLLEVDSSLPSAGLAMGSAAVALSEVAGSDALEALVALSTKAPDAALPGLAVALGIVRDRRSIPILEPLADHVDALTRQRALAALSEYCSETSVGPAVQALRDSSPGVRRSATHWFARCGRPDDASLLADRTRDSDEGVRSNALRGLIRLTSNLACQQLGALLEDSSMTVRELARSYEHLCGPSIEQ
jgi:HEAT repeat protein